MQISQDAIVSVIKFCKLCGCDKLISQFYTRRKGAGHVPYCKKCTVFQSTKRSRNFKKKCIDYKGGKCERCAYCKCNAALQFHHLDPSEKQFNISHIRNNLFTQEVKTQLDKCILLCSNCHREQHDSRIIKFHQTNNPKTSNILSKDYPIDVQKNKKTICSCGNHKNAASLSCIFCYRKKY